MRILLVDDSLKHRRAGKKFAEQAGHIIHVGSSYAESYIVAMNTHFDVALIDLLMPAEPMTLGHEGNKHLGSEIGIGYVLAIALTNALVDRVAVVTDTNHHDHPMAAAMDWLLRKEQVINGKPVRFIQASINPDGSKDWADALATLMGKTTP